MSEIKPIQKLADATRDLLIKHIRENTAEDDGRREAERDARVRDTLAELRREGNLPPPISASPQPATSAKVQPASRDEAGADPAETPWTPGVDIQGSKHRLRIAADYQAANTYDTEEVWVVLIDPPLDGPCPVWQPQIVLRDQPRAIGPWMSADQVLVCSVDDRYIYLDLAARARQPLGWGLPTPDARRFARVSGPGINSTQLEIIDTRTQQVLHTLDTGKMLKPLAFDPTGRVLACRGDSHLVLIDTIAGTIVEQILLASLGANVTHVSLPDKERLLVHGGDAEPRVFSIRWPDRNG